MNPIRLVVADDQKLIRMALSTLAAGEPDIELVAEAADGKAALTAIRDHSPDVLLLDIRMPIMGGLEVLRHIETDPDATVRVIMMTTFDIDQYVFESLEHGAAGFLTKDTDPEFILHAVRVVAAGESLLSPGVTRRVIDRFTRGRHARTGEPHPGLDSLTARETEILGWVATGLSNDEIAERLVVSPATVRTHVGRAMMKLRARDRAQLVVIAYRSDIDIPE
ncbi:response regulator [Stackebrandtia nassauensis]|uniref:Two component transcriptional regulator, LuxR family n=1 Tax=Stackebrandtia nassauensis (strain DSM 44728 / CIP 108903 / NRRL B-16338 / NBRC 102104 / LLR-40K-21) TaxID=446470 RepID=D3PW56_STANL|nr:response regulator transcription factor [Stackebrandtia nassauensis]ADD41213.1 two component transcriptional regulator, LuxR family [Stackebrandtia nassauensis DSM 44728]